MCKNLLEIGNKFAVLRARLRTGFYQFFFYLIKDVTDQTASQAASCSTEWTL
jgi:hypothetical protein